MNKKRREGMKTVFFMAPSFVGTSMFYVIPFVLVIFYAVWNNPVQREFTGLDNFVNIIQNKAFQKAVKNTTVFSLTAVPCAIILPLLTANILLSDFWAKSIVKSCLISPIMVPTASVILVWNVLFGYHGKVNEWITGFGLDRIDWLRSSYGLLVIGLLYLWKNFGYYMIIFLAALSEVPKEFLDAARVDGAGSLQVFFRLKLRYIAPSLVFVTLLALISSFKIFREIYLLTGNYPHESLYMLQHFMNNTFFSLDYQKMSAAAVFIAAVLFLVTGGFLFLEHMLGKDLEE